MLQGHQSWLFHEKPVIISAASVVGPFEGQGPLAADFDIIHGDLNIGQESWEKAEQTLIEEASELAIQQASLTKDQVQFAIGGDLMNQIVSSTFAARTLAIPFLGVFGACSTAMESLALAAMLVNSKCADRALAVTGSHNAGVEKQYRYPTEYGSQKPPTAQFTVTGAGAALVAQSGTGPIITSATIGKVVDMGMTDPFNMGAAMAPAAVDTIIAHLRDFNVTPDYYDLIVTGDLAQVGHRIAKDMLLEQNIAIEQTMFHDCGLMIYDFEKQKVLAGASGCACSAVVTYGHILKKIQRGELKRVLIVATGALLSPLTFQQGESIPCIAHAVSIESQEVVQ